MAIKHPKSSERTREMGKIDIEWILKHINDIVVCFCMAPFLSLLMTDAFCEAECFLRVLCYV